MLVVERLVAGYKRPVLKGISFELREGEVMSVVGPNAAGKSTLLKAIAYKVRPMDGRVLLEGKEMSRDRARSLASFMPSEGPPRMALSALEYVALARAAKRLGWRASEEDLEKAMEVMERLGIASLAGRELRELSAGQRQMVALAHALAKEPKLLLLDEPTSALDLKNTLEVMEAVVKYVRERGAVAIAVHHDLNVATEFSDKIAFMKDGKLVAVGRPDEVVTKEVVEAVYGVEAEVLEVRGKRKVVVLGKLVKASPLGEPRPAF